jgi:hypothetical protein
MVYSVKETLSRPERCNPRARYALKSVKSLASEGQNVIIDEMVTPLSLNALDSIVKNALAVMYERTNVSFDVS